MELLGGLAAQKCSLPRLLHAVEISGAVCLLAATLLANGRLDWQGSNAMLPLALLLGGLLGGALTALRAGR